jgi:hypothetical protein
VTLIDNWLEMSVRFVVADHGIRESRTRSSDDPEGFDAAGLEIASTSISISSLPPLRVQPIEGMKRWPKRE